MSQPSQSCDQVLRLLEAFKQANGPGEADHVRRLLHELKGVPTEVLLSRLSTGEDPLDVLTPSEDTIGFAYFIEQRASAATAGEARTYFDILSAYFEQADVMQLWCIRPKAVKLAEVFVRQCRALNMPILAIRPLMELIDKYTPHPTQLTPLHPIFARVCIEAHAARQALPILDMDIQDIDPSTTGITIEDFLLYHYYGGILYTELKQYTRALEFYSLAIAAPAQVCSAIQLDAYKRYVLVSLIHCGRILSLPKHTAANVIRTCKAACGDYIHVAACFETYNDAMLRSEFLQNEGIFREDANAGLVQQCFAALYRGKIQKLTVTYLTLSVSDICKQIGLDSAETRLPIGPYLLDTSSIDQESALRQTEWLLLDMIEKQEIFATISHEDVQGSAMDTGFRDGMVTFHDSTALYNDMETSDEIGATLERVAMMDNHINAMDRFIGLSKDYRQKLAMGGFAGDSSVSSPLGSSSMGRR